MPQNTNLVAEDFYSYAITFPSLLAGATASGIVTIEADAEFVCYKQTYFTDVDPGVNPRNECCLPIPTVSVLVTDSGSGRQLANIAQPITNQFGTGQLPFILPRPKIFLPASSFTVQVRNFGAADYLNLTLSFIGTKRYYASRVDTYYRG